MPVKSCYHPFSDVFCFLFMLNISIFIIGLQSYDNRWAFCLVVRCVNSTMMKVVHTYRMNWLSDGRLCILSVYHEPRSISNSVKRNVTQFTAWMRNYIEWLWTFITPCAAHVIRIKLLKYCLYDSVMWFIAMNKSGHTIENCSKVARTSSIIIDSQICTISMIPVLRWLADSKVRWLQIIHG